MWKEINFETNSENYKEDIIKSNLKDNGDNSNNNDVSISEDFKNDG